jgi:teichuronopeptide biosynthesis TupA-like protein
MLDVPGRGAAQALRSAPRASEKAPLFDRLLDRALPHLKFRLPRNRFGDNLYHWLLFLRKHHRLPTRRMLWNDMWYRVKTSREIRDPLRIQVSDKELVKDYVRRTVGERYNVPTLAVLRSPAEVDSCDFPADCCIKPTHASAEVILRTGGAPVDRERIKRWFAINYYLHGRESNYRTLQPKVIVEPLIFGSTNVDDFKIFCWRGVPKFVQQDFDRHTRHTRKIFDTRWNEQDFSIIYPRSTALSPKPRTLEEMLAVARALSAPFSFVRIDLYSDDRQVLVGEITNCSANAGGVFLPRDAEHKASQVMFR